MSLSDVGDRDDCPVAGDQRRGGFVAIGCWVGSGFVAQAKDERAYRLDGEWPLFDAWGAHALRFGADFEDNRASDPFSYSGSSYYLYIDTEPGSQLSGGTVPDDVNEAVRQIIYQTGGLFTTRNRAWYIEDSWSPHEQLLL